MMTPEQQRCLELAERAIGLSEPNPRVGCVIRTLDGQQLEGHTHQAGSFHAEAHALHLAKERGIDLNGATAWVSLEPCSHQGRTPACSSALVQVGIARVHVACLDPNPLVSGRGVAELRRAGVEVFVDSGDWMARARAVNIGFMSRMERRRPWVRLKIACSLDGATALINGRSQWITSSAAREDGHRWRARASAILTGIGTVRDDDPRLDVRGVPVVRQPIRVVVDSRLEINPAARVLDAPGASLVYTVSQDETRWAALKQRPGVEVCTVPATTTSLPLTSPGSRAPKSNLAAVLADLAQRGVNELHVEAGEKLNGSLLREGLVDELLIYLAPSLLGRGRGLAAIFDEPLQSLDQQVALEFVECHAVGPDLRLRALTAPGRLAWEHAWRSPVSASNDGPLASAPGYPT